MLLAGFFIYEDAGQNKWASSILFPILSIESFYHLTSITRLHGTSFRKKSRKFEVF